MSETYDSEAKVTLAMTEDEIIAALGMQLAGPQALPLRPAELVERGRRWLGAQQKYLEVQVCTSEPIRRFALETTDTAAIAVEVAKLLASLMLPVNPVTLAVLLAKRGLKTFCSTHWEAQNV